MSEFRHLRPVLNRSVLFWTLIWFQTPMSNFRHFFSILDTVVQYLTVLLAFGHCCPIFDSITCFWTLLSNIWQYYLLLDTIVQILDTIIQFRTVFSDSGRYYPFLEAIALQVRAIQCDFWKRKINFLFFACYFFIISETKRILLTRKSCT